MTACEDTSLHKAVSPCTRTCTDYRSTLNHIRAANFKPGSESVGHYEIEVRKSEQALLIRQGSKVARRFYVSFGRGGPGDKHIRGDNKTPVGIYRIIKIKPDSPFHSFLMLNYPNVKDAFYGLKDRRITMGEFDRIVEAIRYHEIPPQDTHLGGAIGIHGIGTITDQKLRIHQGLNWTKGCIALTNTELDELKKYVEIGTRVVIYE